VRLVCTCVRVYVCMYVCEAHTHICEHAFAYTSRHAHIRGTLLSVVCAPGNFVMRLYQKSPEK
jgi:hypothetical protein